MTILSSRLPGEEMKPFVKITIPMLVWMLIIFISSAIPQMDFPEVKWWGWPKMVHLIYYGMLCGLAWRYATYQDHWPWVRRNPRISAWLLAVVYGASDEIHQYFTPGRHARVTDVMIDGAGALIFLGILYFMTRRGRNNNQPAPAA